MDLEQSDFQETIVGLSSGNLPSGVAIIRISGPQTRKVLSALGIRELVPRLAKLVNISDTRNEELLDRGLCLWFPGPNSFTGEDCAELHVHGGRAVVDALLSSVISVEGVRLADAGEFSRRAFENGKFDLTEIEGISDLIAAQTEAQRKQALSQSGGSLRNLYDGWRQELIRIQAMMAAEIDFVEEDDVPEDSGVACFSEIDSVAKEIRSHLDDDKVGEIIRDGFKVAIMGPPNAGKSTLLNTLAKRDVAIVTDVAGTTRDVLDVHLNIEGYEVVISDTAGLRDTIDLVEIEGIKRANIKAEEADLVIWLDDVVSPEGVLEGFDHKDVIYLLSKDDVNDKPGISISCKTGNGLDWLISEISSRLSNLSELTENSVISRKRYRICLGKCLSYLDDCEELAASDVDLVADNLRSAGVQLGKITGRIDVEDLLDVIFSEFCVGK